MYDPTGAPQPFEALADDIGLRDPTTNELSLPGASLASNLSNTVAFWCAAGTSLISPN